MKINHMLNVKNINKQAIRIHTQKKQFLDKYE